jgi:hypothetical protein
MSLLVNDDLIWVSIPRCASTSIERAFIDSSLDVKHYTYGYNLNFKSHYHIQLNKLYDKFGHKETVCIKRNYTDRWISALQYIWKSYEINGIPTLISWEDIDNEFLYKTFTKEYVNVLYSTNVSDINIQKDEVEEQFNNNSLLISKKLAKYPEKIQKNPFLSHIVFFSQNYWTSNKKCTHEFDFSKIDEFESFIKKRYNMNFKLEKLNKSEKPENKIVKNEELRIWIWENFEKRFENKNKLI